MNEFSFEHSHVVETGAATAAGGSDLCSHSGGGGDGDLY